MLLIQIISSTKGERTYFISSLLRRIHIIHFFNTMEKRTRIIGSTTIATYNDISGMIGLFSAVLKTTDLEATKEKENYYDDFCDHQEGSLVSFYEPDMSMRSTRDVRSSKKNSSNNSKLQSGSPMN